MTLWQKNGGTPQPLPVEDVDGQGYIRTHLDADAQARALCGWTQAPDQPAFDPATQECVWLNGAWVVQPIPTPAPAPRTCSVYEFMYGRLDTAARIAIRASADPVVQDFLGALQVIPQVELDGPLTVQGVQYMEAHNLLTPQQAAALLA